MSSEVLDNIISILERFGCQPTRRADNEYEAFCPHHEIPPEGHKPSLGITLGAKGQVLLNCLAGCQSENILQALGLEWKDLFPGGRDTQENRITHVYSYHDEKGNEVFQSVRLCNPKDFRQRVVRADGSIRWTIKGVTRYPYRLPDLMKKNPNMLFIVEGEKDVDRLWDLGYAATCNPGGAGKWLKSYSKYVKGKHLILIPDNDDQGITHMRDIANKIQDSVLSIRLLKPLPDVPNHGDLSFWLNAGGSMEELKTIIKETPRFDDQVAAEITTVIESATEPQTELWAAREMVKEFGVDMHYCFYWKRWVIWDGTIWEIDRGSAAMRYAKETIKVLRNAAKSVGDNKLLKFTFGLETRRKLDNMLYLAQSEDDVPKKPSDFDKDPWLLNCENGMIDLRDGELYPHAKEKYITKSIPIHFDRQAVAPLWEKFLSEIFDNNHSLIQFVQRALGYSLSGSTEEQCFFILYGHGANGKGTLLNLVYEIMGEYAKQTTTETFMAKKSGSIPNDIAMLRGARFVTASEVEEGRRFAEALVKQLTGEDVISARFLHSEFFEFRPEFKIWIAVNNKPAVRSQGLGMWRRIHLIPFDVTIEEENRDPHLFEKLIEEAPGILNWLIAGCLDWQERGLRVPEEVKVATDEYKYEMDIIGRMLEETCFFDKTESIVSKVLYAAYKKWSEENGEKTMSQNLLGRRLKERALKQGRTRSGQRGWLGFNLISEKDGRFL